MFVTHDLTDADQQVAHQIFMRTFHHPVADIVDVLRFPVGFFFIRGDRAGAGEDLAKQIVSSYGYWNDDAGKYLDMVFPGWGKEGGDSAPVIFDRTAFLHCRDQLEARCKWRYSGLTDILLLNYEARREGDGRFSAAGPSFESCIWLPVEQMQADKHRIPNLDRLMHELIAEAKACWADPAQGGVWQISDRIGFYHGRKKLWDRLIHRLDITGLYNELRPFAVCDLRSK